MPKNKKYLVSYCSDCNKDFISLHSRNTRRFCPHCGENINVTVERIQWMDPLINKRRKQEWTEAEDDTVVYGRKRALSYKEIANIIGPHRTEKACAQRGQILIKEGRIKQQYRGGDRRSKEFILENKEIVSEYYEGRKQDEESVR